MAQEIQTQEPTPTESTATQADDNDACVDAYVDGSVDAVFDGAAQAKTEQHYRTVQLFSAMRFATLET